MRVPPVVNLYLKSRIGTAEPISIWVGWLRAQNTISDLVSQRTNGVWPRYLYTKVSQQLPFGPC